MSQEVADAATKFEDECSKLGYQTDLVTDELDLKRYTIPSESSQQMKEKMEVILQNTSVEMQTEEGKNGTIFTFTQRAITDDHMKCEDYWTPVNKRKTNLSQFINPKDAKRVKNKQTMYQKLSERIDQKLEDQYKHPTGKHRRTQSPHRSSFQKSKTFGGLAEAIAGNSIPIKKEPDTNIALAKANRSNAPGEEKETLPYNKRLNAYDLPTTIDNKYLELERTIAGTQTGRAGEDKPRTNQRLVPDPLHEPHSVDGPEEIIGRNFDGKTIVIPDTEVAKNAADPMGAMAKKQNMRPLGVFGPADLRQPNAGPVSNVIVQHPRDRNAAFKITKRNRR